MIEYELIEHDQIKGMRILVNTIRIRSIHMHHDAELLYVLKGSGNILIRNQSHEVKKEDCILINAYDSHEILSDHPDFTLLILQFSSHIFHDAVSLRNILFLNASLKEVFPPQIYASFCQEILFLSSDYFSQEPFFSLSCISRLSNILYLILRHTETIRFDENEYARRRKTEQRMNRISEYVEANYQTQIRLSDLASEEGLTIPYLSHLFHEQFGISFQDYLTNKRLEHAVRLMRSEMSLTDISAECGFSDLRYMTKAFRQSFHMTPQEYRKEEKREEKYRRRTASSEYIFSSEEALRLIKERIP